MGEGGPAIAVERDSGDRGPELIMASVLLAVMSSLFSLRSACLWWDAMLLSWRLSSKAHMRGMQVVLSAAQIRGSRVIACNLSVCSHRHAAQSQPQVLFV